MIADVDDEGGVLKTTETLKGGVSLTESIDFSPKAWGWGRNRRGLCTRSSGEAGAETKFNGMAGDALVTLLAKKSGIADLKYNLKFNHMTLCLIFTCIALCFAEL